MGCMVLALWPADAATVHDSAQRGVEVPAGVTSVVPAGAPAQVLLHALCPGLLAGLVEPFKPEHAIYADPKIAGLPQIPQLTRTDAPGDVAAVAALKPGLVVDYGNVSARFVAADEKIQQELSTPTVLFGGDLAATGDVVETLGGVLDVAPRAAIIAALAKEVLAHAAPVSGLADNARVTVYVARGPDGLSALRAGTRFDEPLRLAGGRNVVAGGGGTFQAMTVDQVVALKPAVVIFGDIAALSSPLRAALPKETRVLVDSGEPYNVLTAAPSLNRLIALAALPAILHPDIVKPDPDFVLHVQTTLFPPPAGIAVPAPLQVKD
jgi:iron complex transport system substrate-binding protein